VLANRNGFTTATTVQVGVVSIAAVYLFIFAAEYCISFNANKSKCMVKSPTGRRSVQNCEFVVEGKPMELVASYSHL